MRIVIVGDGKVGLTLAAQLSKEGHDIVMIDNNAQVLRDSVEQFDVLGIFGNGASLGVQRKAGVGKSDLLIAATSADEVNLLSCVLAKKLGVRRTIARVRNPEYSDQLIYLKDVLGLSMTINPERAAAMEILNLVRFPAAIKRDSFAKGRVEIIELIIRPGNFMAGRHLSELTHLAKAQVLICAVERGDEVYIPKGAFQLREGDKIYVTGTQGNLVSLVRQIGAANQRIRNVMMIGGSRIAFYLAAALLAEGANVKIVEINEKRCIALAEQLPQAQIIHGDGSQPDILDAENLKKYDALIALTNIDEENMVLAMYGSQLHIPKVIAKINRMEYRRIFQAMGIESVVSPKNLVCNDVVRYVRAMENSSEDSILTLHRIVNDRVEALEFLVTEDRPYLGKPLSELRLKADVLLTCINRCGNIIIPRGSDFIKKGDSIVVVTTADKMYSRLDSIFD